MKFVCNLLAGAGEFFTIHRLNRFGWQQGWWQQMCLQLAWQHWRHPWWKLTLVLAKLDAMILHDSNPERNWSQLWLCCWAPQHDIRVLYSVYCLPWACHCLNSVQICRLQLLQLFWADKGVQGRHDCIGRQRSPCLLYVTQGVTVLVQNVLFCCMHLQFTQIARVMSE